MEYLSELMTYSDPLRMVVEPQREFEDFLETTVQYPLDDGTGVIWRGSSDVTRWYDVARSMLMQVGEATNRCSNRLGLGCF